jgi:cobalt-zinc-cadmium efflux system outer membrane protein
MNVRHDSAFRPTHLLITRPVISTIPRRGVPTVTVARLALVMLALAAGGCAAGPFDDSAWAQPAAPVRSAEPLRPPPPDEPARISDLQEPAGPLTMREALAAALLGSPDLAATAYEIRAREAEALQAGRLPNPELALELDEFGGTGELGGVDAAEVSLTLSQLIELGGKRAKRQSIARYEAQSARWEDEIRRIDVLSRTASDYVRLLAAERHLQIAHDTAALARRVYDAVGERVAAGKVSPLDRTKADVELAQAEVDLERAQRMVETRRIRLASNWGSIEPQFDEPAGDLDHAPPPPELSGLLAQIEGNPDLARWAAETARRQAEVELALAQRVGDLTVTGGVRYFNEIDETAFVTELALPLPLFDRNQGGIDAARLRTTASGHLEEAARIRVRTAVAETHQALETAFIEIRATRDRILPGAELAFQAAEEAFREGKIGALDLFDAERTLFDARRRLVSALTSYHLAVIAGERLIGAPLHGDDQTTGENE